MRNDLVHFVPNIKSFSINQIKEAVKIMLDSIKYLVNESGTIILKNEESKSDIINLIININQKI